MPPWLLLVVLSLATYRITRLAVKDDFPPIAKPREWLTDRGPLWTTELLSCHWCASGWVSLALIGAADLAGSVPLPAITWFAVWAAGAWIAHYERTDPDVQVHAARVVHEGETERS